MAELKPYHPSLRDRLAQMLMGDGKPSKERREFVQGLTGSSGLNGSGFGLADLIPGGQLLSVDDAMRAGDPQMAAVAIMPGAGKLGAAAKGRAAREAFEHAPYPGAKHGHLAERYPETAPPELKVDKKRGKEFLGKARSAEEDAMMKDRKAIQDQMDAEGFEPYFPPDERFDADKAFYPTEQSTLRDVVGKKEATREAHEAVSMSPEAMGRLRAAFERGQQMPGAENWYWMGQLEQAFIDELGPEAGREAFKRNFAGGMAATTGGMDPMNNLMAAQYGNYLQHHGLPVPEAGHQLPSPLGGPYVHGNMKMHEKFAREQDLDMDALQNPKRHNFQYNFLGHEDKATIDEQMSDLIKPGMGAPPGSNFGSYEKPVHVLSQEYGVDPRYFQEVAWAGGKQMKNEAKGKVLSHHEGGRPMIQFVNEAIERTHRLTGMPRAEIVKRALVRGEIPLYGAAGATAGGLYALDGEPLDDSQF